jgi:hypothetical protein
MNSSILTLLQLATSLLLMAQRGTTPPATAQKLVVLAEQSIQISTQALAPIDFPVVPNNGPTPNIVDVANAPYIGPNGKYTPMGSSVQIVEEDTSFGDLNGDAVDDAATVVKETAANGTVSYALAALLNQGGILFNIADAPLDGSPQPGESHGIAGGLATLGSSTYYLLGNQLLMVK